MRFAYNSADQFSGSNRKLTDGRFDTGAYTDINARMRRNGDRRLVAIMSIKRLVTIQRKQGTLTSGSLLGNALAEVAPIFASCLSRICEVWENPQGAPQTLPYR